MFLLSGVWGKVKLIIAGIFAALLPILYVLGRRDGKKLEQRNALEDAVNTERERADFYKTMDEHSNEAENSKPRNRSDLINRLRGNGL